MPSGNSSSPTSSTPSTKAGRGMRKGTKSCLECRKRKVKCVFGPDDANVCVTCKARGSKCTEQRKVIDHAAAAASAKVTLEERVAQLEALIKSQAAGNSASSNDDHDSPRSYGEAVPIRTASMNFTAPESTMSANVSDVSRTDVPHSVDPVVSLFDNPIWRNESNFGEGNPLTPPAMSGAVGGPGSFDGNHSTKIARTCAALLKDLPPSIILAAVLNATSSWWSTWRAGGNWLQELMAKNNAKTLQDFIVISLSSSEPPVIALGILALAISLQQLDPNLHQDILVQLPRPPGELFQIYFDRVERLIINDIDYSTSKAGIEVIMMSGKIFMNLGLVKRTWIFIHRAISHAQLLGYHRPHRTSAKETDYEMNIRQQIWFRICEQDAYTSLLLGLPYAADSKTIPQEIQGRKGSVSYFKYRLVRISAEIIDRNQMGRGCSLPLTQSIQQMLELAATEVDADFWDAPKALREAKIARSEYMDSLAAQFWHAQMKVVLHQPLMIQSIENNEFAQHREACLEACRNALRLYHFMRSDAGKAFSMVKFVDYQAFICSALLLLGLLGYGNPTSVYETIDQDKDWEIVQSTLDILRSASEGSNNSIATQAVQGLETLSALVRAGKTGQCAMSAEQCKNPHAQIVVPGSGTITVLPGTFLRRTVSPSVEPPNAHPPPVFHLSHGIFQSLPSDGQPGQQRAYDKTAATGYPTSNDVANQIDAASAEFEIPYMDFDWTNMVDMNTADDWAWLADLNGNGMTGML